jgi:hypothetical protein
MKPKKYFTILAFLVFGGLLLFVINYKLGAFLYESVNNNPKITTIDGKKEALRNNLVEDFIIGSWTQKRENASPVVFTFKIDKSFYNSIKLKGKYKFEENRLFLYYDDGDADVFEFVRVEDDILYAQDVKFIKRPSADVNSLAAPDGYSPNDYADTDTTSGYTPKDYKAPTNKKVENRGNKNNIKIRKTKPIKFKITDDNPLLEKEEDLEPIKIRKINNNQDSLHYRR